MARARGPVTPLRRLRPFALPLVALVLLLTLRDGRFDVDDVRAALADGEVERALGLLSRARPGELIEPLTTNLWMTERQRAPLLAALLDRPDDERAESADAPTLVAPRGSHRRPPDAFVLREPSDRALEVELREVELGLDMGVARLPAGTLRAPTPVPILAGTTVSFTLAAPDASLLPTLGWFKTLDAERAELVGRVLATAAEIAGDDARGRALVTGIVALDYSLAEEALGRLRPLLDDPDFGRVARELSAIALDGVGLDRSALALLGPR